MSTVRQAPTVPPPGQPYVLLVESEPDDESLALRILRKYRIANHVDLARDGEEALKMLRERPAVPGAGRGAGTARTPELVLLDFSQKKIPALEIVARMRALPGMDNVPVALLCRTPDQERQVRESTLPRLSSLSKPIGFFKLLECILRMDMHWFVFAEKP